MNVAVAGRVKQMLMSFYYSLGCIRQRWQRSDGETGKSHTAKQFVVRPIDSVRGRVHIVPF